MLIYPSEEVKIKQNSSVPVTLWTIVALPLQSNDLCLLEFARDTLLKFAPVQDRRNPQELLKSVQCNDNNCNISCVISCTHNANDSYLILYEKNYYLFVFVTENGITQSSKSGHLMSSGNIKSPNRGPDWHK